MFGSAFVQMKGLLEGLMGEIRRAPYTVVVVLALAVVTAGYVLPSLVRADRTALAVARLREDVEWMRTTLLRETIRNRIATIDGQIYALEREEARYTREAREAPDAVSGYLHRLRTEKELAQMELRGAMARSPNVGPE